jgi:hypothetical protein
MHQDQSTGIAQKTLSEKEKGKKRKEKRIIPIIKANSHNTCQMPHRLAIHSRTSVEAAFWLQCKTL